MTYSPFRHLPSIVRKSRPIQLTFFVTRRCNAHCPFCFYLRASPGPAAAGPELTLDEIERVARPLGSLLWLAFSGGEIFLRDDLVEIARTFYRHNRPAIMLFPTNGMLPELVREHTEAVLKSCPKSVIAVKLSLDGVDGGHDRVRDTPGSFDRTMRTHELLADLLPRYPHFELGVNTVFCSENQDAMDGIIDHVRAMPGIAAHTISLARGALARPEYAAVDLAKYERAVGRLERDLKQGAAATYRFSGARLKAAQDIVQRRLILRTARECRSLVPCYAGRLNAVLTEDGGVYPCEMLSEGFGNVRENGYDLRRMLRAAGAAAVRERIKRRECFCTHECYCMTNVLFNPRLYPALAGELLQLRR